MKMSQLNLGCGHKHNDDPDVLHHDMQRHHKNVRLAGDLALLGGEYHISVDSFSDGFYFSSVLEVYPRGERVYFDEIVADSVLEHLPPNRFHAIIDFCWGSLVEGGLLKVLVPEAGSNYATIDPTHYRGLRVQSFDFFDPDTAYGKAAGFYGLHPWKLLVSEVVPNSDVNLRFVLQKRPALKATT